MMRRVTGGYKEIERDGATVRAFTPRALPPADPPLVIEGELAALHDRAVSALERLDLASALVPDPGWFLYGFVRKEAVISSRIEGTQATLQDVLTYEVTESAPEGGDVEEVCNYVRALQEARRGLRRGGVTIDLLRKAHRTLLSSVASAEHKPGQVRETLNWIGGTRPADAVFVPPAPGDVPGALSDLERWLKAENDGLPALVRVGLAHAQFETIHPFFDGNGRIGRLLIALLLEQWGLLDPPLLYISVAFRLDRLKYYGALTRTRSHGDWEGWTRYFLRCVHEAAEDGVGVASRLARAIETDRASLLEHEAATVTALRLFEALPRRPIVTSQTVEQELGVTKPTANKAIEALLKVGVLNELTGKRRGREFGYARYLEILTGDDEAAG